MKAILTILRKEVIDNLRDKRSVFFSFIYGPILMPVLILTPLIYGANQHYAHGRETPVTVHVAGEARAPNLIDFFRSMNVDVETAPDDFRAPVTDGDIPLVLEIAETYPDSFTSGEPARVILHYNGDDNDSQRLYWRIRGDLETYNQSIAARRMMIRGFDRQLLQPVDYIDNDLSRDDMKAGVFARLIVFMVVLSMTLGGFYLAIDTTTGEREHRTLEPLLSLPVTRFQVTAGKYLAIFVFILLAFATPILVVGIASSFIPERFFGHADPPSIMTFLRLAILVAPLTVLITSFLMALAAFARSNKEAQTLMGFAMIIPMAPIVITQFVDVDLTALTASVPILGQSLIAERIVTGADIPLSVLFLAVMTSLAAGGLLYGACLNRYRRDDILA